MSPRRSNRNPEPLQPILSLALCTVAVLACLFVIAMHPYDGVFLLDDYVHIVGNPRITRLTPIAAFFRDSARPLVDLSLAVNYSLGGLAPAGYHVLNICVHALAALVLYGLVGGSLQILGAYRADAHGRDSGVMILSPKAMGLMVAAAWFVHPLQTQSVNYVIQRAESMMGMFYLLTLYCVSRAAVPRRDSIHGYDGTRGSRAWGVAAISACAAGMLCKTVMVTAPVIALLYDRAVLATGWRETFRRRWWLHLGLFATLGVPLALGALKLLYDPSAYASGTVGFNVASVTPWQYFLSQGGVILHYIRLCYWPQPLVFDYMWTPVSGLAQAAAAVVAVAAMVAVGVWLYIRCPPVGFTVLAFFAVLAPTSSFVPIVDLCVEHRMYVSLAAVLVLTATGLRFACERAAEKRRLSLNAARCVLIGGACVAIVVLAAGTTLRNRDYRSALAMWKSVVTTRPENARARSYLGDALMEAGQRDEAIAEYRESIRINPNLTVVENNLANALAQSGRLDEAIPIYEKILARDPRLTHVHLNFALVLQMKGRNAEAVEHYRIGLSADPGQAGPRHNMGAALRALGRLEEAEEAHRTALAQRPRDPDGWFALGGVLEQRGRTSEATVAYHEALRLRPDHAGARSRLAALGVRSGEPAPER